jgi:hypothetical protein
MYIRYFNPSSAAIIFYAFRLPCCVVIVGVLISQPQADEPWPHGHKHGHKHGQEHGQASKQSIRQYPSLKISILHSYLNVISNAEIIFYAFRILLSVAQEHGHAKAFVLRKLTYYLAIQHLQLRYDYFLCLLIITALCCYST